MEIDIRPEVNMLGVLKHLNYKPWFALAEFVDNSLASVLSARSRGMHDKNDLKLVVRIKIDSARQTITVTDNAYGIELDDFPRAFKAAEIPPDRSGLSEFGMGMKSAASWFAGKWSVRTSVMGEPIQRTVSFDLEEIMADRTENLPVMEALASASSHFTVITLEKLNHFPQKRTVSKIKEHLTSMYRKFLRSGVMELWFNDEHLQFKEVEVLVAPSIFDSEERSVRWLHNSISIDLGGGKKVTGFAGLRSIGSTSEAGFSLFRRGRLIVGSYDETYRPTEIFGRSNSYVYQRLFGEFDLHGFDVSHTKDGIQWAGYEELFLDKLKEILQKKDLNLLGQAAGFRTKSPKRSEQETIANATKEVAGIMKGRLESVLDASSREPLDESYLPSMLPDIPLVEDLIRRLVIRADGRLWQITLTLVMDDAQSDWLEVGTDLDGVDPVTGESCVDMEVRISFAHPFSREYIGADGENSLALLVFGCSVAIALSLGKKAGARSQFVLEYLNAVLRGTFSVTPVSERP
ncbi:ATP-binding protein [Arthrobacter sp. APC 3897]|uniref:ATP-binding protein n=1 Tax=Arthrobacter sp. APC 3897 TaxID=3035204 RepID=UPI0025B35B61|nr:ATP-binding protein [Arthrobacter sp. APC 3897]MDN3483676.1 ATP-binding protein [Arthrobacter sp. APC 3897]